MTVAEWPPFQSSPIRRELDTYRLFPRRHNSGLQQVQRFVSRAIGESPVRRCTGPTSDAAKGQDGFVTNRAD